MRERSSRSQILLLIALWLIPQGAAAADLSPFFRGVSQAGKWDSRLTRLTSEGLSRRGVEMKQAPSNHRPEPACDDPTCLEQLALRQQATQVVWITVDNTGLGSALVKGWLYEDAQKDVRSQSEYCSGEDRERLAQVATELLASLLTRPVTRPAALTAREDAVPRVPLPAPQLPAPRAPPVVIPAPAPRDDPWPTHRKVALAAGLLGGASLLTTGLALGLEGKLAASGCSPPPMNGASCVLGFGPGGKEAFAGVGFTIAGVGLVSMTIALVWPQLRGRR